MSFRIGDFGGKIDPSLTKDRDKRRSDGRAMDELRPVTITPGYNKHAEGSALIEVGDTRGDGVESVTLDGSGSYDPDGSLTAHAWYRGEAQIGSGPSLGLELAKGTHHIALVVTDDRGEINADVVVVQVRDESVNAPSGLSATASGGRVGRVFVGVTPGIHADQLTPEVVAQRQDEIVDEAGYLVPTSVDGESELLHRFLRSGDG